MPTPPASSPPPSQSAVGAERAAGPVLKFRLRVTDGDAIAIGPGKIALLEAVDSTGSITAAAKQLGMSYRRAWMLLDELNGSLRLPAVDSAKGGPHGGGSALTGEGRRLIQIYRRIESQAHRSCQRDIQQLLDMLSR